MPVRKKHPLDSLLRPRSMAVIGASERPGSVGRQTMENLLTGGFQDHLYAVNPAYDDILGVPCFPDLQSLPEPVEHVVLTVGDPRVEAALDDVIAHGAAAATMISSLVLKDDEPPLLRDRVAAKIAASGLRVCGANGMGFYNFTAGVWVCGFDTRNNHVRGGNVTLISHSGSGMSGIIDCEERIDFNLAVSTGQELCVSMDQYMDFALEQPETRVIGLFMESARNPAGMIAAFEKARDKGVPVVALKVGRTELSARLAVSHSGAIAGRDDAYQALFDRYGVQRVEDMDELTTTLMMFAQPHGLADGGLAAIHDSGGERQLLIDLADRMGVPLAPLEDSTVRRLEDLLDPGLPAVNPLDAWGAGGPDSDLIMENCLAALMSDRNVAMGAVVHDRAPLSSIYPSYIDYMRRGHQASGKPACLVSNRQGSGSDPLAITATREGFPVIDGLRSFLVAVRCMFGYRDYRRRGWIQEMAAQLPAEDALSRWCKRLAGAQALDEYESGCLLSDFGFPMNPVKLAGDEEAVLQAAQELNYPLALKTAEPGIMHKTDQRGVILDLADELELRSAYRDISARLGRRVMLSPMVDLSGVEMVLGMVRDEQFGPLVMLGFGGVNVETIRDVACAMPPFDSSAARRLLDSLQRRPLLDGLRDRRAVDVEAFCAAAERFSVMVHAFSGMIDEIDVNPVIVHPDGCVAVDALVIPRRGLTSEPHDRNTCA
jgi:acyl-CoA synthetase (NDP forming)